MVEVQKRQTVLMATVDMRLDACRRMSDGMRDRDTNLYNDGRHLHTAAEKIAARIRY